MTSDFAVERLHFRKAGVTFWKLSKENAFFLQSSLGPAETLHITARARSTDLLKRSGDRSGRRDKAADSRCLSPGSLGLFLTLQLWSDSVLEKGQSELIETEQRNSEFGPIFFRRGPNFAGNGESAF